MSTMPWAGHSTLTIHRRATLNTTPLAFGARVLDIVGGAAPALGDVHFHAEFVNSAPGAPLPDLVAVNAAFCAEPFPIPFSWSDIQFIAIEASIKGTLHATSSSGFAEGTPGMLAVKQTGLLSQPPRPSGPLSDQ